MPWQETLNERQALAIGTPGTINSSSIQTLGINMSILRRARAFFNIGAISAGGTFTIALQSSATKTGTYANITSNPVTNPVVTGITTANALNCLEIRADQMPIGQPWLRAIITETAGFNVAADAILIGDESEYKPGNLQSNAGTLTNNVVTA